MNYIYFSTINGFLVDNYEISRIAKIVYGTNIYPEDFAAIREFANQCKGICKEVNLSMEHIECLVKNGMKIKAVSLYHRRHPDLEVSDCRKIIDKIEESLTDKK